MNKKSRMDSRLKAAQEAFLAAKKSLDEIEQKIREEEQQQRAVLLRALPQQFGFTSIPELIEELSRLAQSENDAPSAKPTSTVIKVRKSKGGRKKSAARIEEVAPVEVPPVALPPRPPLAPELAAAVKGLLGKKRAPAVIADALGISIEDVNAISGG